MAKNNPKLSVAKWISPQPGRLYTETKFGQPRRTFCFSPVKGTRTNAAEVAIFPFGFGSFKLTWSKLITMKQFETEKKEDGVTPKYDSYRDFLNSKLLIGYRTESVLSFKEIEEHPFVVESTSAVDGVSTEIIVTMIVRIHMPEDKGPLKILTLLPDPFSFIFSFVREAIARYANEKSSKEVRKMNTDKGKLLKEIEIDGMFYLDYLNEKVFKEFEFEVSNVNFEKVVLAESDKSVLDAEKSVVIAENTKIARVTLNDATEAENTTALKFYQGKIQANTDFIVKSSDGIEKMNAAYGRNNKKLKTLIVGGENNKLLTDFIAALETSKS